MSPQADDSPASVLWRQILARRVRLDKADVHRIVGIGPYSIAVADLLWSTAVVPFGNGAKGEASAPYPRLAQAKTDQAVQTQGQAALPIGQDNYRPIFVSGLGLGNRRREDDHRPSEIRRPRQIYAKIQFAEI